ncbi:LemA family protein [Macrococcus hajekii]|uniref:LemA family protein n=1 Tax=Macrococcus hajekii TaxID=198482 RepID=A0A4V3BE41_9STAP|nr:LemA family protein [Macrococcus hajekii]TDM02675.1 LemA family protein [Macrococcus hajekii]GGB02973.1 LemA family protein [Macrococcus hajekii]
MKKLLIPIIAIIAVLAILGSMVMGPYNKLVSLEQDVNNAESNIDTNLQRRLDLIPNLVETVKGYAKHESDVFKNVADARSKLAGATENGSPAEKAEANAEMTSALGRLIAISEAYPELKADTQFTGLRDELAGTENRIAIARRDYNDKVSEYNKVVKSFPMNLFAGIIGKHEKEYFKADSAAKDAPSVDFNTGDDK